MPQINRASSNANWASLLVVNTGQIIEADDHLLRVIDFLDSVAFFMDDDMPLAEAVAGTATTPRLIAADKLPAAIAAHGGKVTNVALTGTDLVFTGNNGAFNGSIPLASLSGGGGGADGAVTNVVLTGTDLVFTGINGGFNGTIDLSGIGGGGGTADGVITNVALAGTDLVFTGSNGGFNASIPLASIIPNLAPLESSLGVASGDTNMGAYTAGSIVSDNLSAKANIQELSDAITAITDGKVTSVVLTGTNLVFTGNDGAFSGSVDLSSLSGGGGTADGVVTNVVLTGTDLVFTGANGGFNASVPLASVLPDVLYLGLFANVGALPAAPDAGSIALVGTGDDSQVYKWDDVNGVWYTEDVRLWHSSETTLEAAQPAADNEVGDVSFLESGVGSGYKIYGVTSQGTWEEQRVARINLTTTGPLDLDNPFGNEYDDGAGGAITGVTAFSVASSAKGGRGVIVYENATEPTITGATLYSSSQAFVPSALTHIIFNVIGTQVFYHFIEV